VSGGTKIKNTISKNITSKYDKIINNSPNRQTTYSEISTNSPNRKTTYSEITKKLSALTAFLRKKETHAARANPLLRGAINAKKVFSKSFFSGFEFTVNATNQMSISVYGKIESC
jgi:hypothetical protein